MLNALRHHSTIIACALAIILFVCASVFYVGSSAIDDIVETKNGQRAENFAEFLLAQPGTIDTYLTGIGRQPDTEAKVRQFLRFAGIERFAIFDDTGREIYQSRSQEYEWLMRDRPGGMSANSRLAPEVVNREGRWQVLLERDGTPPTVLQPLVRDGSRVGFLLIQSDVTADRNLYSGALFKTFSLTGLVVIFAAGVPFFGYVFRRGKMAEADAHIEFLANHDSLTRLFNRRHMQQQTDLAMVTARATRERMAYFFVDLDGLGDLNATFGQTGGDEILRVTAMRLQSICARNDLVARIGSDDFAVLRRNVEGRDDLTAFARQINRALCEPITRSARAVHPSIAIGCAVKPEDGKSHAELVKHAEIAHRRHKTSKQGECVFFEAWMDDDNHRRRFVEDQVRRATENNAFALHYQPLVCGKSGRVLGFEALLRLRDETGAMIPPGEFVPVAEARGHIKQIGSWVIREATRQATAWPDDIFVSVNLSAVQFVDGDLVSIVDEALAEAGLDGRRLELEVVESLVVDRSEEILDQLSELRRIGISLAMDDFGTGYSSLSYLWSFPFDKLKIDQSFMVAMANGEKKVGQLLRTIISLGHNMGMKITAEGVEEARQVEFLKDCGCDQIQGFYYGRPVPPDEIAVETLSRFRDHTPVRSEDEPCEPLRKLTA